MCGFGVAEGVRYWIHGGAGKADEAGGGPLAAERTQRPCPLRVQPRVHGDDYRKSRMRVDVCLLAYHPGFRPCRKFPVENVLPSSAGVPTAEQGSDGGPALPYKPLKSITATSSNCKSSWYLLPKMEDVPGDKLKCPVTEKPLYQESHRSCP